jgi:hypothetical protein
MHTYMHHTYMLNFLNNKTGIVHVITLRRFRATNVVEEKQ